MRMSTPGPLRPFAPPISCLLSTCHRSSGVAAGGTRRGLMLGRSALRSDSAAMLGLGSRRRTRYVRFALCAQTAAPSQLTKRAARADPSPALLAAPEIAPAGHRLPRRAPCGGLRAVEHQRFGKGAGGRAGGAPVRSREASPGPNRARGPRAQRASCSDSARLFERSSRSERSEFGAGAPRPSIAGHPRAARASSEVPTAARPRLCSHRRSKESASKRPAVERPQRAASGLARVHRHHPFTEPAISPRTKYLPDST